MAISTFELAKKYYPKMWDINRLEALVAAGKLTKSEMEEIITKKEG